MSGNDDIQEEIDGGYTSLSVWNQRADRRAYGDGELAVRGPFPSRKDGEEGRVRLSITVDDCEYDDCGGTATISLGLAEVSVLETVLQDIQRRDLTSKFAGMSAADSGVNPDDAFRESESDE